ncbi:MAG: aldo/keto reductase [Anaerolineae bacterium]|nr:aldo/keto reductase [Anaerolineae bacterium]
MIYNELGKSGIKISALSFGSMRWQSERACHEIIHRGLDLGMNYIDTSSGYVGGQSEKWSGSAVKNRRDEIYFSSKSNWAQAPDARSVRRSIESSLKKAGLDHFDFYQIWGLQSAHTLEKALAKGGTVEGVRQAQKEGLITAGLGFTFHGDADLFKAAVDTGEFLCATVSYNLLKRRQEELLDYAAANGVGTIIMNPLGGGTLATDSSLDFLCHDADGRKFGPWYGALRFLLANKSITTAIVGFRQLQEIDLNLQALEGAESLDEAYRRDLAARVAATRLPKEDFCTGCGYCRDCPNDFNPTKFMQAIRDFGIDGQGSLKRWLEIKYIGQSPAQELDKCVECGWCEEQCPQHLKIVTEITKAKALFGL